MARTLRNLMGAGIGAQAASLLNGIVADNLTATGSVQVDALALTGDVNVLTTVGVGAGVRLPALPQPGDEALIANLGANALSVYPPPGATLEGGSANAPLSLPAGASAEFIARVGSSNWIALSSGVTVAPPAGLATPTLTNSSALGAVPLVLSWSDTDYTVGLYGQLQIATDSGFSSITQNRVFFIDGDSWARLDEAIGLATPAGTYYARIRTARDNESGATTVSGTDPSGASVSFLADVSAWSNTFTDTIGAQAALNTTNGTNKDSLLTVTGTPALSFSGTAANGNNSVRSTLQQGFSKAQFEIAITSGGATGTTVVGIEDGTTNFNTVHGMPGLDGSAGVGSGIAIAFYASGSTVSIFHSAGGVEIDLTTSAGSVANNDTFTIVYDKVNNTLEVHRTRSGTTVQIGTTQSGLPALSAQWAYCGTRSSTSAGTMNFGSTAYAKTPGSGVAAFWA